MTHRYNLDSLEFKTVRDGLVSRLTTPLGRTGVEELAPLESAEAAVEALARVGELADALDDVPDVVKRMLNHEAHFDATAWAQRLKTALRPDTGEPTDEQNELFA